MEGSLCFNPSSGCDTSGKVFPVAEYDNTGVDLRGDRRIRLSRLAVCADDWHLFLRRLLQRRNLGAPAAISRRLGFRPHRGHLVSSSPRSARMKRANCISPIIRPAQCRRSSVRARKFQRRHFTPNPVRVAHAYSDIYIRSRRHSDADGYTDILIHAVHAIAYRNGSIRRGSHGTSDRLESCHCAVV
jgi:hypothetical protein